MAQLKLIRNLILVLLSYIFLHQYGNCYWAGGNVVGSRYGAIGGSVRGSGAINSVYPPNRMANLPPGMINLGGEIVDTTNKIVQKSTGMGGTQYYSYINQKAGPVFQTPTMDVGKHFIVFQDVNYPPGDGHYIILRRWRGSPLGGSNGGVMYEAYYLDLGDSINALVSNWNLATYVPTDGRRGFSPMYTRNVNRLTRAVFQGDGMTKAEAKSEQISSDADERTRESDITPTEDE